MAQQAEWLAKLNETLPQYLETLQVPGQPGRFLPCLDGLTPEGEQAALGFSCFALKTYYTLGLWEKLPSEAQEAWIAFLKSYQVDRKSGGARVTHNAFIDWPIINYLAHQIPIHRRLVDRLFRHNRLRYPQKVMIAETKQAIATLAEVGERPYRPYRGFPTTPEGVRNHLLHLDWSKPWGAGGQASALAVFLKTQSPAVLEAEEVTKLVKVCAKVFEDLADTDTGAYFTGKIPEHGELINGAMKVLTALDWLNVPIHYPNKLIDTCLERLPAPQGCHLVDAIYVLYRCSRQTRHKREKSRVYCEQVLDMIKEHQNRDGGFSYYIGRSQTHYYGVPFSQGFAESDIHGTSLLTWALAMICENLDVDKEGWRVIRP